MGEKSRSVFKVVFYNHESIYEIYAKEIRESAMFGFLEVEQFVFGENASIVVDPSEEKLKLEFNPVKRTYIPAHSIIRIDEVEKEGTANMKTTKGSDAGNVKAFPKSTVYRQPEGSEK